MDNHQQLIVRESNRYDDILQFGFDDHYRNSTLKAIAMIGWHRNRCPTARLLMKLDDDVFVNIDLLVRVLPDISRSPGIHGHAHLAALVPRYRYETNYVSPEVWPSDSDAVPVTVAGAAYIMDNQSRDTLLAGLAKHQDIPVAGVPEDNFLIGFLANRTGVWRHHSQWFRADRCWCPTRLHTIPVHFECPNQRKVWHTFTTTSGNSSGGVGSIFYY
ncbi:lactosylceramide 1,3-N-acetyl-beta-D-glucosaminyltransferase B-like [Oppia nitens]|uniref:lactosylceramide 1,3-N-acetyl-beta-D-glucosaminyltransferase B-like n=1 Tax=Oppia nitens TaxID=1686743 RepID=UPI0023D9CFD8|nr:lactosylceramide 1,3-N-acetyl-beta-D-glucosaminyltransferase B-like [Oppia nitens]